MKTKEIFAVEVPCVRFDGPDSRHQISLPAGYRFMITVPGQPMVLVEADVPGDYEVSIGECAPEAEFPSWVVVVPETTALALVGAAALHAQEMTGETVQ